MRGIFDRIGQVFVGLLFAVSPAFAAYTTIVANLPTCVGNRNGQIISVADAVDYADCSVGEATGTDRHVVACQCDTLNVLGPYWRAVGGSSGGGFALLAGDADGQAIQGRTGAEKARVDIGAFNSAAVTLFGSGATPARVVANDSSSGIYSGDGSSNMAVDSDYGEVNTGSGPFSLSVGSLNIVSSQTPPTNANDACTAGDLIPSTSFIYFCVATNTWKRVAISTWP